MALGFKALALKHRALHLCERALALLYARLGAGVREADQRVLVSGVVRRHDEQGQGDA